MSDIIETYKKNTRRSAKADERVKRSIIGGNSRGAAVWQPHTLTVERGEGSQVFDADGREYTDLINNFTSLVHGHAYPPIVEAATRQIAQGTAWTANNHGQAELAETLIERIPATESVRFTNSGTEAGMLALQIARAITGRLKILMSRFGYHGSLMEFEIGTFGGFLDFHGADTTHTATYNDADSFEQVLAEHGSEIAAVFVEPVMGAGGVVRGETEFLERVGKAANEAGALFVVDEVITYRLSTGGEQMNRGIEPDLTMLGKLIGGGFPVGAVGGRREYMKIFDPTEPKSFHSGTFVGNPVTMAAGVVSTRELTQERIDTMAGLCDRLDVSLHSSARKLGLPFSTNREGSMLNVFFQHEAPTQGPLRNDEKEITLFYLAALNRGLLMATRGMIALSTVMDEARIDDVAERAAAAMADLAAELG
ncbi:MAG: aminotransferase class III-fold pyridoxal phosphate-dependent enzyme [Acidimicrobiia bacterium]|nr:aminotransferase class III-fold pyridoxal phosphate-dependent enzyme [Acidimicrobiia bacterium]